MKDVLLLILNLMGKKRYENWFYLPDLKDDYLDKGYSEAEVAELDSIETIEAIAQALRSAI